MARPAQTKSKKKKPRTTAQLRGKNGQRPKAPFRFTEPRRKKALEALAQGQSIKAAAEAADVHRCTIVAHMDPDNDPEFAMLADAAIEAGTDAIEDELYRRGVEGLNEPIVYKGVIQKDEKGWPVTIKRYSDILLIFNLKARRPDKYAEKHQHSGKDGGPLKIEHWHGMMAKAIEAPAIEGEYERVA